MGIFSSLGSIVGGAFFGPTGAKIGAALGGSVDGKKKHKAIVQQNRGGETEKTESRINFQQLADDARAAGFNPLTALRTTGGMGNVTTRYSTPLIDHGKFGIGDALAGAYSGYSNYMAMEQQKKQFGLETDLLKSQIAMNKNSLVDAYSDYGDTIPVQVGNEIKRLNLQVAKRHNILPGSPLTNQEMQDITGEIISEITAITDSSIADVVLEDGMNAPNIGNDNVNQYYDFFMNSMGRIKQPFGMLYKYVSKPNQVSNNVVQINANEVVQVSKIPVLTRHPNTYGPNSYGLRNNDAITNTLNNLMNNAFN